MANDWSLREIHEKKYDEYGRFVLTAAPITGWLIGIFTEVNEFVITILMAFIVGGVILNVLKVEWSEAQNSSLISFLLRALIYTLLLLLV